MGYERDDQRFRSQYRGYGGGAERGYGRQDYGSSRYGPDRAERGRDFGADRERYRDHDDDDDRGFFDRAGDEVRSWFGDDDAQARRRERDGREYGDDDDRGGYGRTYGAGAQSAGGYGGRDTGASRYGGGFSGREQGGNRGQSSGERFQSDPGYTNWRQRQIDSLDRDYDEYRREHQSKFDNEFAGWRGKRNEQRGCLQRVEDHMEVTGSDGEKVGTVDKVRGDRIVLTKKDAEAGGRHHSIPSSWIESVDTEVRLSKTAAQAKQAWRDEERNEGGWLISDEDRQKARGYSGAYNY